MPSKLEPHFEAILALIAGGISIEAALRSRPEFPIKATWKSYAYDNRFPERRIRLETAQAEGKGKQSFKFQFFTEADYERSLRLIRDNFPTPMNRLKFDGCPGYTGLFARSKSDPEFAKQFKEAKEGRKWGGRAPTYNDSNMMEAIAILKQQGVTVYRQKRPEGFPSYDVLWERSRRDPEFAKIFSNAVETVWIKRRRDTEIRNRHKVAERKRTASVSFGEQLRTSLLADDLYGRVNRAVNRRIDPDAREDIVSDIVEAVLSGEVHYDEIERVAREFVTAHFRLHSSLKTKSLDAKVYDNNDLALIDQASTSEWAFEGAI
jgi:hypothetical protein